MSPTFDQRSSNFLRQLLKTLFCNVVFYFTSVMPIDNIFKITFKSPFYEGNIYQSQFKDYM